MPHARQDGTASEPGPAAVGDALSVTQRELASESTPAKEKYGPDMTCAPAVEAFEEDQYHLGKEMDGGWLGAMPVDAFLDKYVSATAEPSPNLSTHPFERVPRGGVESARHDFFVSTRPILETSIS